MSGRGITVLRRTRSWACPRPAHFSILVIRARGDLLLQLTGEFDSESGDAFDECVAAALSEAPRRLVVDLSALTSMDSIGVASFVETLRSAHCAGVKVLVDSPNESVRALLGGTAVGAGFSIR
jgi:anti-anti-sigma factor